MNKRNVILCWLLAILISAIFIGVIGYKWFQVRRIHGNEINIVRNASELDQLFAASDTIEFKGGTQPYKIPTGFFIQSLAFLTSSDVNITGYVWQKYPKDFPPDIEKGFVFPEEIDSSSTQLNVVYEVDGEQNGVGYRTIGWYFDVTLRQTFDYSRYPLDFLTVWIRLWPKDLKNDNRVILIPDFSAYSNTNREKFGLDKDIVSGEWEIDETFFSYNNIPYDTDFGFFDEVRDQTYKEFYFNLGLRRTFINAFVINLVPLFVVALLLFAQMMTVTGKKDLIDRFGFNTSGAIATCSALFFVVMLAHVQVRRLFSGSGLTYIEFFYLTMYLVVLITALNSYIFSLGKRTYFNLIYYCDNVIPKTVYWPLVLGMMALATWFKL